MTMLMDYHYRKPLRKFSGNNFPAYQAEIKKTNTYKPRENIRPPMPPGLWMDDDDLLKMAPPQTERKVERRVTMPSQALLKGTKSDKSNSRNKSRTSTVFDGPDTYGLKNDSDQSQLKDEFVGFKVVQDG